jgi:hypothetical protein
MAEPEVTDRVLTEEERLVADALYERIKSEIETDLAAYMGRFPEGSLKASRDTCKRVISQFLEDCFVSGSITTVSLNHDTNEVTFDVEWPSIKLPPTP